MNEFNLDEVKKKYEVLRGKYKLPSFEEMNRDFYIEKIAGTETDFLTREIRRFISDKIFNYLRFVETLINPVNVPMFVFSVIKSISPEDKKILNDIYGKLSKIDIKLIRMDIDSSEKEDAQFISETFESWSKIKKDLSEILKKVKSTGEGKEEKNNSGYFG